MHPQNSDDRVSVQTVRMLTLFDMKQVVLKNGVVKKQLEVQYGNQQVCAGIAYKLGIG